MPVGNPKAQTIATKRYEKRQAGYQSPTNSRKKLWTNMQKPARKRE